MISDWTIYGVYVPMEGMVCVSCWDKNYSGDYAEAMEQLLSDTVSNEYPERWQDLQDWLNDEDNNIAGVATARSLWGQWGLPAWLSEIVDDIKANTDDVFHAPMISIEYDGWEDQCNDCEGEGCDDNDDCYDGVTGPRCYECGDTI